MNIESASLPAVPAALVDRLEPSYHMKMAPVRTMAPKLQGKAVVAALEH